MSQALMGRDAMSRVWNMVSGVQKSGVRDRIILGFVLLLAILFLLCQLLLISYWIAYDMSPKTV
jgi:hypothetical protein